MTQQQDPLDQLLHRSAQADQAPPAPDGWDSPSEQLWQRLRADLDRRKKRRRRLLLWWWWLLAGSLAGAGLWQWSVFENTRKPGQQAARQEEKAVLEKSISERDISRKDKTSSRPGRLRVVPLRTEKKPAFPAPAGTLSEHREPGGVNPFSASQQEAPVPDLHTPFAVRAPEPGILPLSRLLKPVPAPARPAPALAVPAPTLPPTPARWFFGASGGTVYTSRRLQSATSALPNGTESGGWTTEWGLRAGLRLGRHWVLESGLRRTSIRLRAGRRVEFYYQTDHEEYNPQRFAYQNAAEQKIETSFGAVALRVSLTREPSRPVADQTLLAVQLATEEQMHYLRVPLLLRRTAAKGRWEWQVGAGVGLNIRTGYDWQATAAFSDRPGVRDVRARMTSRADGQAPLLFDATLGAGLGYRFAPGASVALLPEIRYGLNSMYRRGAFRSLPVSAVLALGVEMKF